MSEELVPERGRRVPVRYAATLTTPDGVQRTVTVTDVSAAGFRIEGHPNLSPGTHVYLTMGKQGNFAAEIKWVDGNAAGGVLFDAPQL
jgi:hypothetical protein